MQNVWDYAHYYRSLGWAVGRAHPKSKRMVENKWQMRGCSVKRFKDGENLALLCGRLSGNLVGIDIDALEAIRRADEFLPPTGMMEGRPGKLRSHRWYIVTDIPPSHTATCAGGMGGPKSVYFRDCAGTEIIALKGTGAPLIVPPSIVVTADGSEEVRFWETVPPQPATVRYEDLLRAVENLARACGWSQPTKREPRTFPEVTYNTSLEQSLPHRLRAARAYIATIPGATQGQGGDKQTYIVAIHLVRGFNLSVAEAQPLLWEYNQRCQPNWHASQLLQKLECADKYSGERGYLYRKPPLRSVTSCVRAQTGAVLVGVDCANEIYSYVELWPSLAASMTRGQSPVLEYELATVDWQGRQVLLCPPSTIHTNKYQVWLEYKLAELLRARGASEVISLHIPVGNGRMRTYNQVFGEVAMEVAKPAATWEELVNRQDKAAGLAHSMDRARKRLPRARKKLDSALQFLSERSASALSKELVQEWEKSGGSRSTLERALRTMRGS